MGEGQEGGFGEHGFPAFRDVLAQFGGAVHFSAVNAFVLRAQDPAETDADGDAEFVLVIEQGNRVLVKMPVDGKGRGDRVINGPELRVKIIRPRS